MSVKEAGEYNPVTLEKKILKYWEDQKVVKKTLIDGENPFSFLEGPPTANAPPALHHVEVRVFKDLVNRYKFMKGHSVPRKAGWDCHGLPVEVQVEKKLKLENKKDIVDYGVDKFVEECRNSVFTHIKEWDKLTSRMAYWIDLNAPYVTMDNNYIESVWWSLKKIFEKKLLYEGHRVVPYCTRCGTPLSSHEVAQGYKEVKEMTVIVSLPAKDEDFSLLAWTTTPWTLLSNVALAVNPEVDYAVIKHNGEKLVIAGNLAKEKFPEAEIIETKKGAELVGIEYYPLFNHFVGKTDKPAWRVIPGDFVTTEDGTGIVHIAPAFGEDDYKVGKDNGLPLVNPIDEDGKFTSQVPELEGIFAKDADQKIINILEDSQKIVAKFPYTHDYPYCWRCNTPLLYYAMESWFIKVGEIVPKILEKNDEINWFPNHIKEGRFGKWLENARDWSLSRNRFWGTPLPIWSCKDCESKKIIGSRKELIENSIDEIDETIDLHRPYVDKIKLKCDCGKEMTRVEYVIDCWYDSGSAPFAQFHYPFENQDLFEKHFPYDFISEATDQTRGWFYTLLVLSTILFDKPAYKNCVVGGLLLDDKGEKMSKSGNNIVDPWELFDSVGADAVRLQMCSTAPWNAVRFGMDSLNESVVPLLRTLWNCYSFTTKYMVLDNFNPEKTTKECKLQIEDEWIISSMKKLIQDVESELDQNNYHIALTNINQFIIEDLSRWYIKLIRDRLWIENDEDDEKKSAYMTLINVFENLSKIMAPITPFISEEIYQNFNGEESVHLSGWPKTSQIDLKLLKNMDIARSIFESGSYTRQAAKIKLRHPISCIYITGTENVEKALEDVEEIVKKQLNAKEIKFLKQMEGVTYEAKPDFKTIGPKYGKEAPKVANTIIQNPLKAKKIKETQNTEKIGEYEITPEMIIEIKTNMPEGITAGEFTINDASGIVYIESERSPELIIEGLSRDLIRNIQELRKQKNLEELQKIHVKIKGGENLEKVLENHEEEILHETRASKIEISQSIKTEYKFKLDDEEIDVELSL